jgi:hypothetical protein
VLVESAPDYPHFEITYPTLTLTQRISDPVPPPLEPSPAPHSSHTIASFTPLGGLTICTVKEKKPRREPGMSPYPIFHKAKNTLAEHMDMVPTIQTIKNLEVEIRDRENVTTNTSWANPAIQDIETDHTKCWQAYMDSDDDELILLQAPHSASTPEPAPSSSDSLFDGMDLFADPPSPTLAQKELMRLLERESKSLQWALPSFSNFPNYSDK